jgi:tRNA A37 threonylcarbamoyladenosine dehydratase
MNPINFKRTIGLIGEDNFNKINNVTILLVGLGGVGGSAFEALLRSGFKNFILIDKDVVDPSNLNRQILYIEEDVGKIKVEVAKSHALKINKEANIKIFNEDINTFDLNKLDKVDFIIDAIDNVEGKIKLAKYANENDIKFIMSLGMANRLNPSKVEIKRLDKTTDDPLAKKVRYEIKKLNIDTKNIMSVVSIETPIKDGNNLHSMMMVPSSAGLMIAYYVIDSFIK